LLVTNQTLGGENLRRAIKRRAAKGRCRFHVLVPAPGPTTLWESVIDAYEGAQPGDDASVDEAGRRLGSEIAWLCKAGVDADGEIGDPDPIRAIEAALAKEDFDEILVSTPPAGPSSWVAADLPHRIRRRFHLPVRVITSRPAPTRP
jgi:GABA permease